MIYATWPPAEVVTRNWIRGIRTCRKQVHMMPELDQPFGRHRWDPLAEIEALVAKDEPTAAADGQDALPQTPDTPL